MSGKAHSIRRIAWNRSNDAESSARRANSSSAGVSAGVGQRRQLDRGVHSTALAPSRGDQVITSPRVSDESTVCAKLFIDTWREKY